MIRPFVYCPNCRSVRPMNVTLSLHTEHEAGPEYGKLVIVNYLCATCDALVLQKSAVSGTLEDERVVYWETEPAYPMG
ncbi:MAG TPA: hypothetical protein VHO48_16210 [Anaerolineaceae bacterium]|nr:hypothetical protein [Anaerolineaceae bacterium]